MDETTMKQFLEETINHRLQEMDAKINKNHAQLQAELETTKNDIQSLSTNLTTLTTSIETQVINAITQSLNKNILTTLTANLTKKLDHYNHDHYNKFNELTGQINSLVTTLHQQKLTDPDYYDNIEMEMEFTPVPSKTTKHSPMTSSSTTHTITPSTDRSTKSPPRGTSSKATATSPANRFQPLAEAGPNQQ
jgi:hypothetical protein